MKIAKEVVASGVPKHKVIKKKPVSSRVLFLAFALTAIVGYLAGTYNLEIRAAVGPVFGYKAHPASLDLSSLQTVYGDLASHYDGTLNTSTLIDGALHGLVSAAGDTYTVYMDKAETTAFNNDLSGNVGGGIGAEIGLKNNLITIVSLLPDNPAQAAGLEANDVITAINGTSTTGESVDQAVDKIRGTDGTTVQLTILRNGVSTNYSLKRATINDPSVTSTIDGTLGVMTITRFDSNTGDLARQAAQQFVSKGVKDVILDLRDNGGGYLTAAQDVAGLWLNNKTVVSERDGNQTIDTLSSGGNPLLEGIPTAVLVNAGTASASEIVSGALQDYGVAKIVGEQTFGKGSVQQVISYDLTDGPQLNNTQLKVTIAKWYTPKGKNINHQGITPDIKVDLTQANIDAGVDPQMDAAKTALGL
jgi:carboxyl-terminal processing protease